ncbi:MAG TPA: hypothetical protein VNQ15_13650, partial [Verrucomicrobiae bacterium]|nr:hypothetical protein [Verrucomicrobiae bacterium]
MNREISGWTTGVAVVTGIFAGIALWATVAGAQEVRDDLRDVRGDRQDIRRDTRDIREDRREIRQDNREIRQDARELRGDRQSLRDAIKSGDPQAIRNARRELR